MKTPEQIVKALKYRIKQLEMLNDSLIASQKETDKDLLYVFMENEARLNELIALLEYIEKINYDVK